MRVDRYDIGWMIWCYGQGYGRPEDREILTNWFRDDESTLTENDIEQRRTCLEIADAAIEAARKKE